MVDFHQNGNIATLHNLRTRSLQEMTYELETFAQTRKMSLILPCLYSELETEAMPNILAELANVTYLHRIIIGLDRANEDQFRHAKQFFEGLNQNHIVIWNDSPRMRALNMRLEEMGLSPAEQGKGKMSGRR
jgi:glucosyl-3-phosphoglycerate synthase